MKKYVLILALTLYAAPTEAGEALITRVRGSVLTIDAGAEGGLIKGLSVDIVRPPGEAIIHPITGEDLGAPELVIGRGEISKTSNRAANVQVEPGLLLSVRPGDIARFTTPQEEMLMDQERSVVTQEKNQETHQGFRNEISRLTRSIKSVQGRIGGLEQMMKRVERVEEGFRVQLRGINGDMNVMKEDIADLKEAVSLMGAVPIAGLDEEGVQEPVDLSSAESVGQIRQIVQDVLDESQIGMAPLESEELALPDETSLDMASDEDESEETTEEEPFYMQTWFFLLFGVLGILLVAAYFYMRFMGGGDEDEELEEDDLIDDDDGDDDDDDDDIDLDDLDLDEEDDIVVEETS